MNVSHKNNKLKTSPDLNNLNLTLASLTNKTIILIDDVVTTGATLNEAARVLKEAGAKTIYALVLAKG